MGANTEFWARTWTRWWSVWNNDVSQAHFTAISPAPARVSRRGNPSSHIFFGPHHQSYKSKDTYTLPSVHAPCFLDIRTRMS